MTGNTVTKENFSEKNKERYLLESAGEQGFKVAGLRGSHGEGEGDLSLLVSVNCIGGSCPRTSCVVGGPRDPPLA